MSGGPEGMGSAYANTAYPNQSSTPTSTVQDINPSSSHNPNLPPFSTFVGSEMDQEHHRLYTSDSRLLDISSWDYYGDSRLVDRGENGISIISSQPQYRPWEPTPMDGASKEALLRSGFTNISEFPTGLQPVQTIQSKLPSFQSQFNSFPDSNLIPEPSLTTLTPVPVSPNSSTSPGLGQNLTSLTQLNSGPVTTQLTTLTQITPLQTSLTTLAPMNTNFHTLTAVSARNYPLVPAPIQAREIPAINQQYLDERHIQLYQPNIATINHGPVFAPQNGGIIHQNGIIQNGGIIHHQNGGLIQNPTVVTVIKNEPANFDIKLGQPVINQDKFVPNGLHHSNFQNPMSTILDNNFSDKNKINGFTNISNGVNSPTRSDLRKKERRKIRASSLESNMSESEGSNMEVGSENSGQVAAVSSTASFKSPLHNNMHNSMTGAMDVDDMTGDKQVKKKRKRCGECIGCQRKDNCGDCAPCRNDKSHQICKQRRCEKLTEKKLIYGPDGTLVRGESRRGRGKGRGGGKSFRGRKAALSHGITSTPAPLPTPPPAVTVQSPAPTASPAPQTAMKPDNNHLPQQPMTPMAFYPAWQGDPTQAWQNQFIQQLPPANQEYQPTTPNYPTHIYQSNGYVQNVTFENAPTFYNPNPPPPQPVQVIPNQRPPSVNRPTNNYAHTPTPSPNINGHRSTPYGSDYGNSNQSYTPRPDSTPNPNIESRPNSVGTTNNFSQANIVPNNNVVYSQAQNANTQSTTSQTSNFVVPPNSAGNAFPSNTSINSSVTYSQHNNVGSVITVAQSNFSPNVVNSSNPPPNGSVVNNVGTTGASGNAQPGYPLVNGNPQPASRICNGYSGDYHSGSNQQISHPNSNNAQEQQNNYNQHGNNIPSNDYQTQMSGNNPNATTEYVQQGDGTNTNTSNFNPNSNNQQHIEPKTEYMQTNQHNQVGSGNQISGYNNQQNNPNQPENMDWSRSSNENIPSQPTSWQNNVQNSEQQAIFSQADRVNLNSRIKTMILNKQTSDPQENKHENKNDYSQMNNTTNDMMHKNVAGVNENVSTGHFLSYSHHSRINTDEYPGFVGNSHGRHERETESGGQFVWSETNQNVSSRQHSNFMYNDQQQQQQQHQQHNFQQNQERHQRNEYNQQPKSTNQQSNLTSVNIQQQNKKSLEDKHQNQHVNIPIKQEQTYHNPYPSYQPQNNTQQQRTQVLQHQQHLPNNQNMPHQSNSLSYNEQQQQQKYKEAFQVEQFKRQQTATAEAAKSPQQQNNLTNPNIQQTQIKCKEQNYPGVQNVVGDYKKECFPPQSQVNPVYHAEQKYRPMDQSRGQEFYNNNQNYARPQTNIKMEAKGIDYNNQQQCTSKIKQEPGLSKEICENTDAYHNFMKYAEIYDIEHHQPHSQPVVTQETNNKNFHQEMNVNSAYHNYGSKYQTVDTNLNSSLEDKTYSNTNNFEHKFAVSNVKVEPKCEMQYQNNCKPPNENVQYNPANIKAEKMQTQFHPQEMGYRPCVENNKTIVEKPYHNYQDNQHFKFSYANVKAEGSPYLFAGDGGPAVLKDEIGFSCCRQGSTKKPTPEHLRDGVCPGKRTQDEILLEDLEPGTEDKNEQQTQDPATVPTSDVKTTTAEKVKTVSLTEPTEKSKGAKSDIPECDCFPADKNPPEPGSYYTHLGSAATLADLRRDLEIRVGVQGNQLRIEKVCYTGKEGKTTQGCPLAKWIIRRIDINEKILCIVKNRQGHKCPTAFIVVCIVAWEGIPSTEADNIYSFLPQKLNRFGVPTTRRCATNENRTCACQGLDPDTSGASFSFGCSWSMYYNGCKYARSKSARKFKLAVKSEETEVEERINLLATMLSPLYANIAPKAFYNQCLLEREGAQCRLGVKPGKPFSGKCVTVCIDFCAHAHRDLHNMQNGCTVVVSLERHRGLTKAPDEQLHVLPLYVMDSSDEYGSKEGQEQKIKSGAVEVLEKFPCEVRVRSVPLEPCRRHGKKRKDDGNSTDTSQTNNRKTPNNNSTSTSNTTKSSSSRGQSNNQKTEGSKTPARNASPRAQTPSNPPSSQSAFTSPNVLNNTVANPSLLDMATMIDNFTDAQLQSNQISSTVLDSPYGSYDNSHNLYNNTLYNHGLLDTTQNPMNNYYLDPQKRQNLNYYNPTGQWPDYNAFGYRGNNEDPDSTTAIANSNYNAENRTDYETKTESCNYEDTRNINTPKSPAVTFDEKHNKNVESKSKQNWDSNPPQNDGMFRVPKVQPAVSQPQPVNPEPFLKPYPPDQKQPLQRPAATNLENPNYYNEDYLKHNMHEYGPGYGLNNSYAAQAAGYGYSNYHFGSSYNPFPYENYNPNLDYYSAEKNRREELLRNSHCYNPYGYQNYPLAQPNFYQNSSTNWCQNPPNWCLYPPAPPPPTFPIPYVPETPKAEPIGEVVDINDNVECFKDSQMGGVAIALGHGSVLFECAKYEMHSTTALRTPNRLNPARISLVFYQHRNLNRPNHGLEEYAEKMRLKQLQPTTSLTTCAITTNTTRTASVADAANTSSSIDDKSKNNSIENITNDKMDVVKPDSKDKPDCDVKDIKRDEKVLLRAPTLTTMSWTTLFPMHPCMVTGPYQEGSSFQ